jgi:hypothetical protein
MDLNEILVFARVMQTSSFTTAAAQLGMAKSTVSRKVFELEERLGSRLLQRTTRKLSVLRDWSSPSTPVHVVYPKPAAPLPQGEDLR